MARPLAGTAWQVAIIVAGFAAIAIARAPLLWTLAALAPLSVAFAWWTRR
jgi:hypothetical protein